MGIIQGKSDMKGYMDNFRGNRIGNWDREIPFPTPLCIYIYKQTYGNVWEHGNGKGW